MVCRVVFCGRAHGVVWSRLNGLRDRRPAGEVVDVNPDSCGGIDKLPQLGVGA